MYIWREYVVRLQCGNPPTSSFHHAQADLEVRLKEKEEELQFLKQQAEREKEYAERVKEHAEREKEQAERVKEEAQRENEELQTQLEMLTKRDQEHKKQLESVKRDMERQKQNTLTMQDVCMLYVFNDLAKWFASYHTCRSTESSWNWRGKSWRQSWKWKRC